MITNTALDTIFTSGANPKATYTPNINEYVNLTNKLGLQIIRGADGFENPFDKFRAKLELGDTIETSFTEAVAGVEFSLTEDNPFRISNPSLKKAYHTLTKHVQYLQTYRGQELKKAMAGKTLGDFLASMLGAIKYGSSLDEYNANKLFYFPKVEDGEATIPTVYDLFGDQVEYTNTANPLATDENKVSFAEQIFKDINKASDDLQFPNTAYSKDAVINDIPLDFQVLLINKEYHRLMRESVLSDTYNADFKKLDIKNVILIDEDLNTSNPAVDKVNYSTVWSIVDSREMIYYYETEAWGVINQPIEHYTNHSYDYDRIISYPYFACASAGIYEQVYTS